MMNPEGQKEDLGLHSHTKSPQKHHEFFRFLDLSHEELTLEREGGNESGRGESGLGLPSSI
jgi:hypothetical protein